MHVTRSRIDVLREVPGFLAGDLFKGIRELLNTKMITVKENIEDIVSAAMTIGGYNNPLAWVLQPFLLLEVEHQGQPDSRHNPKRNKIAPAPG